MQTFNVQKQYTVYSVYIIKMPTLYQKMFQVSQYNINSKYSQQYAVNIKSGFPKSGKPKSQSYTK